jgi:hypothetical protein
MAFKTGATTPMRSLAPYLVTLPLLVTPACEIWIKPAFAQSVSAEEALTLLARGNAADAKCHHLSAGEHQELADYLAKAEVAETGRSSSAEAQSIIATGRAEGRESLCGEESRAEVAATLEAARQAMADGESRGAAVADAQPAAPAAKAPENKVAPVKTPTARADLASYGAAAMAYYVERRCGHLSPSDARAFWNLIVTRHNAALKAFGKRAVAAALQTAEATAGERSCGIQTAALVDAAFKSIQGL